MLEELLALMGDDSEEVGGSGCFGATIIHDLTLYPIESGWARSNEKSTGQWLRARQCWVSQYSTQPTRSAIAL